MKPSRPEAVYLIGDSSPSKESQKAAEMLNRNSATGKKKRGQGGAILAENRPKGTEMKHTPHTQCSELQPSKATFHLGGRKEKTLNLPAVCNFA